MSTTTIDPTGLVVGAELPPFQAEEISRTTLALFGPASGDFHPLHLDIDVARSAGLDDVFAHGMLSMAYLGRLLTQWADQRQIRALSARFTAITPLYARPVCRGTVTEVVTDETGQTITLGLTVNLQDGTQTLSGTATIHFPAGS
ncbi:MAG: hypothetical protein L0H26_13275 [Microlunatus sp.]|nr:hypothetical protein [Microlunatus sp.]